MKNPDQPRGIFVALGHLVYGVVKNAEKTAKVHIFRQGGQQGLGIGQAVGKIGQLVFVQEQQAVGYKKGIAGRIENEFEFFDFHLEPHRQCRRSVFGYIRGFAFHDDGDVVPEIGKGAPVFVVNLAEEQFRGQHIRG